MKTISAFILAALLSVPAVVTSQAQNAARHATPVRHHRITLMDFSAVAPDGFGPPRANQACASYGCWHPSAGE